MKPTEFLNIYKLLIKIMLWAWAAIMLFYFILVAFKQVDFRIENFLKTLIFSGGGILFWGLLLIYNRKTVTKSFHKIINASTAIQLLKEKEFILIESEYGFDDNTRMVGFVEGYQVEIIFEIEKGSLSTNFNASPLIHVKNFEEGVSGWAFYKKNKQEIRRLLKEHSIEMVASILSSIEKARMGEREGDVKLMHLIDKLIAVAKSKNFEPLIPNSENDKKSSLALTTE